MQHAVYHATYDIQRTACSTVRRRRSACRASAQTQCSQSLAVITVSTVGPQHCCDRHITCCMQHKIHNMQHAACNTRRTTCRVQRGSSMVDAHRSLWAYDCVALGWAVQIVGVQDPIHLEEPFTVQVCRAECCGRIHRPCGYNAVTTQVIDRLTSAAALSARSH
jgi:hypothetical protein